MGANDLSVNLQCSQATRGQADAALGLSDLAPTGVQEARLALLCPVTTSDIRDALKDFDISFIWRSDKYELERRGIRTCLSQRDGLGSDLKMTYSAAYLAVTTGSTVYLPSEGDPTLMDYLQRSGLLPGGFVTSGNFDEMMKKATARGKKVYSVDDLGEHRDAISAVSQEAMEFVNKKSNVAILAGPYAPPEEIISVESLSRDIYDRMKPSSGILYLKTCTGEGAGIGVIRVTSAQEMDATIAKLQATRPSDESIIVQPEIKGKNFRFQIFLNPNKLDSVPVVSLTEQIVADDGIQYTGSRPIPITSANLAIIGDAIVEFAQNIRSRFPNAVGFASCDFFRTESGKTVLFDPALRPTGNTASFMIRLNLAERGVAAIVTDYKRIKLNAPGLPFSELERVLGPLVDAQAVLKSGVGVLPWGYNQYQGEGTFMIVGRDQVQVDLLWEGVQATLRRNFPPQA